MPTTFLYIQDTLADWEPAHVLAELHSGNYLKDPLLSHKVVLCGRTPDTITTMGGLHLKPDMPVADINPGAGDLLLLPGATSWLAPEQAPVITKVREVLKSDAVVAAICGATMALANDGILDSRPHTSNDLAALRMLCAGYHGDNYYVNEPAVTHGNLITASGVAPIEFAYHILRRLNVMEEEALAAWYGLYSTRKPEFFYALMETTRNRAKKP